MSFPPGDDSVLEPLRTWHQPGHAAPFELARTGPSHCLTLLLSNRLTRGSRAWLHLPWNTSVDGDAYPLPYWHPDALISAILAAAQQRLNEARSARTAGA